jgi:hypothetical protein
MNMSDKIYLAMQGLAVLNVKKVDLSRQLKDVQSQKGEAVEVGGNIWHGNFSFEELNRQELMLNNRIGEVAAQILKAEIVGQPSN